MAQDWVVNKTHEVQALNEHRLDVTDSHTAIMINTSSSLKSHLKCHFDIYQGLLQVVRKTFEYHHLPAVQNRTQHLGQLRHLLAM